MRFIQTVFLFLLLLVTNIGATTVYFDGEDGGVDEWVAQGNGIIRNIYSTELGSKVVSLAPGTYDIGLGANSWHNTTERVLSFNLNTTGRYTILVSVNTTLGHRWLFYNDLNVHVGFHGTGILNAFGNIQTHNGSWQKVTLDLDRELQDTEPDNRIVEVNGVTFGGVVDMIDNVVLDNPSRDNHEDGENGIGHWQITDNTPAGATVNVVYDDEEIHYRGEIHGEHRVDPFDYAYNDNVISLHSNDLDNAFTIGAVNGANAWSIRDRDVFQWKMRTSNRFRVIVHILTTEGEKDLVYSARRNDIGISGDGLEIHHGVGISRNGDGVPYGQGTDGRWITYTRNLVDDLHDYDPDNRLIAVNGITIRGTTLIDDIELLSSYKSLVERSKIYEDAEDGNIDGWSIREGNAGDIQNVYDVDSNSQVIQFTGGGSYILGAMNHQDGWNNTIDRTIAWRMKNSQQYTIYIPVTTTDGFRQLFYTFSPNRGLRHGVEGGIHHGLGASTIDGRWRTITRDLNRDLKDAEPENEIIAVNGFIFNGGDNGMVDDILLYNADETIYEDGESGFDGWEVSDNTPAGATISNIADNDRQGRHLQGNVLSFSGSGADNAYRMNINNSDSNMLQWRFRDFGLEPEILSANPDARGTVRDLEAFEFRVSVDTEDGARDLTYTLGATHQGLIEGGATIHHGLGDDRIRGSIWAGDDPINEMGLWQTITRDLEEDIRDFEPNNRLVSINSFEVRNSGLIDDIKVLSNAIVYDDSVAPIITYENAEDGNINGWSIYDNATGNGTITNVEDATKGGRVIELSSPNGQADGFMLGNIEGGNRWNDIDHNVIQWSMNYSGAFVIYISVETTNGHRYMRYGATNNSEGRNGEYIRVGLGANANDGTWRTFTRDISADIEEAEAGNQLIAIDAFLIRGSGRLDDIQTLDSIDTPIVDTIPPVITLLGNGIEEVTVGEEYQDAGALAEDNIDGNITADIVVVNSVDSSELGNYTVTYNVVDASDNQAVEVIREVHVVEDASVPDTIYEDAEDGETTGWSIYNNSSGTATITNIEDVTKESRVIELSGNGRADGYIIGAIWGDDRWDNREHDSIEWSMNYSEDFRLYISVRTTNGHRYVRYSATNENGGLSGEYILVGIGANADDGTWRTFSRNLAQDIEEAEAGNELIAIDALLIRGSGRIDDIKTFEDDGNDDEEDNIILYEDAEDENTIGWSIYNNSSGTATITNIEDATRGSRVIELSGDGRADGYIMGAIWGDDRWNDTTHNSIEWSMNYSEDFRLYISVRTTNGHRYIRYSPVDENEGLSGEYIRVGIGANVDDGTWRTFSRNLAQDIEEAEAGNELIAIDAFMIRGSGRLDDIKSFQSEDDE